MSPPTVKPLSVNISVKPKHLISQVEFNLTCIVNGSVPDTDIKWTQNNRPFKRGQVSSQGLISFDVMKSKYSYTEDKVEESTEIRCPSYVCISSYSPYEQVIKLSNGDFVTSRLSFGPLPEDDGTILRCDGSNPLLPNSAIEDSMVMNVMCEYN